MSTVLVVLLALLVVGTFLNAAALVWVWLGVQELRERFVEFFDDEGPDDDPDDEDAELERKVISLASKRRVA